MNKFTAIILTCSFLVTLAASAQEEQKVQPSACKCKDCKCTDYSHCGCRSNGTCSCGSTEACCSYNNSK